MPVDLEISALGDLVFTGGRDLSVVQATDVMKQRMMLRLRLPRGSYKYNRSMGSELRLALNRPNRPEVREHAASYARAALVPMQDMSIQEIQIEIGEDNPRAMIVKIAASGLIDRRRSTISSPFIAEIPVPLAPAPGESTIRA